MGGWDVYLFSVEEDTRGKALVDRRSYKPLVLAHQLVQTGGPRAEVTEDEDGGVLDLRGSVGRRWVGGWAGGWVRKRRLEELLLWSRWVGGWVGGRTYRMVSSGYSFSSLVSHTKEVRVEITVMKRARCQ